ncbi:MAG TPA: ABC transporter permease [Bacillota bacterium]|nr:ABC transporter permease [Candidatus Fermentithermobacillaceae bacterium]HOB30163.1 ABC transporter permease [Bacillota bacterium]HOK64053.1 ABC transporter permease [Bacillota bacterium]HOL11408.1 ABC transporter permease [Bacillota bacterium]HOQ02537.1 ABC transporter permease [Bacillota bacterium]
MLKYSIKRILQSIVTVFIVITVVFLLMRLLPVEGYYGERADKLTDAQKEAILRKHGLLDPWYVQLKNFYSSLFKGDLGNSIIYRRDVPVVDILKPKIPYSFGFGIASLILSLIIGLSMGIHMAREKGGFWDNVWSAFVVFINAVPAAVYLLFIQMYVTSITKLPILFTKGNFVSYILPTVSMSLGGAAGYAMWMRRYMVDELNKDYIKLARAKGMPNKDIMVSHVMRNAFVPMAQYLPSSVLLTISGSIYIESLYSIPGMGGLLVDVIQRQDNTLVQALVLIYSVLGIFGLFLGDILMAVFDPRIRLEKEGGAR